MASLTKIKQRLSDSSDAAEALAELSLYTSMIVTGTALGATITLPLIIASSGKAAGAALKLVKTLMPSENEYQKINNSQRIDEIFYLLAQSSYLNAIKILKNKISNEQKVDIGIFNKMAESLHLN